MDYMHLTTQHDCTAIALDGNGLIYWTMHVHNFVYK